MVGHIVFLILVIIGIYMFFDNTHRAVLERYELTEIAGFCRLIHNEIELENIYSNLYMFKEGSLIDIDSDLLLPTYLFYSEILVNGELMTVPFYNELPCIIVLANDKFIIHPKLPKFLKQRIRKLFLSGQYNQQIGASISLFSVDLSGLMSSAMRILYSRLKTREMKFY